MLIELLLLHAIVNIIMNHLNKMAIHSFYLKLLTDVPTQIFIYCIHCLTIQENFHSTTFIPIKYLLRKQNTIIFRHFNLKTEFFYTIIGNICTQTHTSTWYLTTTQLNSVVPNTDRNGLNMWWNWPQETTVLHLKINQQQVLPYITGPEEKFSRMITAPHSKIKLQFKVQWGTCVSFYVELKLIIFSRIL